MCLILHNLMMSFNDNWEVEEEEIEEGDARRHLIDDDLTGQELRNRVQNYLLEWHFNRMS